MRHLKKILSGLLLSTAMLAVPAVASAHEGPRAERIEHRADRAHELGRVGEVRTERLIEAGRPVRAAIVARRAARHERIAHRLDRRARLLVR